MSGAPRGALDEAASAPGPPDAGHDAGWWSPRGGPSPQTWRGGEPILRSGSVARVGLVSVAHRGVLMLDEAPEFDAGVLDALRQPMESGQVTVSRAGFAVTLPARFQLVLAANPCPCGRGMDPVGRGHEPCTCTPHQKRRYLGHMMIDGLDEQRPRLLA